jgi:hypothetical protein
VVEQGAADNRHHHGDLLLAALFHDGPATLLSTSPAAGSVAAADRNSGVSSRPATNAAARSMWLNMVNFSFATTGCSVGTSA